MINFLDIRSGEIIACDNSSNRTILKFLVQNDFMKDILNYKVSSYQYLHYNDELFHDDYIYFSSIVDSINSQFTQVDLRSFNVVSLFDSFYYNKFRQIKRVKNFIEDKIISNINLFQQAYFITLTLEDTYTADTITAQDYSKVRTKIRKFIACYSNTYVFNKDFGKDDRYTKRLHFHGVALMTHEAKEKFIDKYSKKFGFLKVDLIDDHSDYISNQLLRNQTFYYIYQ